MGVNIHIKVHYNDMVVSKYLSAKLRRILIQILFFIFPLLLNSEETLPELGDASSSAISLSRENNIPIIVFSIHDTGEFEKVVFGNGTWTTIKEME